MSLLNVFVSDQDLVPADDQNQMTGSGPKMLNGTSLVRTRWMYTCIILVKCSRVGFWSFDVIFGIKKKSSDHDCIKIQGTGLFCTILFFRGWGLKE